MATRDGSDDGTTATSGRKHIERRAKASARSGLLGAAARITRKGRDEAAAIARQKGVRNAFDIGNISKIQKGIEYENRVGRIRLLIALILIISFVIFAAIAVFAIQSGGTAAFFTALYSMNVYYFLLSLLVLFAGYLIRYPKWHLYLKKLKVKIPTRKNFMIYLSMYSMDITPGRWGRAVVAYTINKLTGVRFGVTFPAIVADIFTDFVGFVVILLAATLLLRRFELLSIVITVLLLIPFVFIYVKRPFIYVRKKLGHIKRLKSVFETGEIYFRNNKLLTRDAYVYSMIYTIPAMFLNGMALYFVMLAFGVPLSVADIPIVLFIFSSSLILGMVTGIPATLGVTDAALVGYLLLFFPSVITIAMAALIAIFFRIVSVWFVQGFGSLALFQTMKYWRSGSPAAA